MSERELLNTLAKAAHEVGQQIRSQPRPRRFRTMTELREAFDALDEPLQHLLKQRLHALRPEAVWTEELQGALPETGEAWLIDPVDGAIQYMHGLPHWCVSLTLVRERVPIAAVLHSPELNETYAALRGGGATLNGQPIRPAQKSELPIAYVATSQPPFVAKQPRAVELAGRSLSAMLGAVGAVRNLGATAWQIADVASGRLDAFWQYGVDDVNLLGATLIAHEAGARVTDAAGRPWRAGAHSLLVAAPSLQRPLLGLLPPDGSTGSA